MQYKATHTRQIREILWRGVFFVCVIFVFIRVLTADIVRMQHRSDTRGISVCLCFFIRRELQKKLVFKGLGRISNLLWLKSQYLLSKSIAFCVIHTSFCKFIPHLIISSKPNPLWGNNWIMSFWISNDCSLFFKPSSVWFFWWIWPKNKF